MRSRFADLGTLLLDVLGVVAENLAEHLLLDRRALRLVQVLEIGIVAGHVLRVALEQSLLLLGRARRVAEDAEDLVERGQPAAKRAGDGVEARGQPALHDHERQLDVAVLLGPCLFPAGTDVLRDRIVEVEFFGCQLVAGCPGVAWPEEFLVRPVDHLLLEPTQKEPVSGLGDCRFRLERLSRLGS